MRAEVSEPYIDLSFECSTSVGGMKRTEIPGMSFVRLEVLSTTVSKTSTGFCVVPPLSNSLVLNMRGTLLARTAPQGKLILAAPRSITYIRNARLVVQAARGDHESYLITWPAQATGLLENWLGSRTGGRAAGNVRNVACRPIDPHFKDAVNRFQSAITGPPEMMEPLVVSFLFEVISRMMSLADLVQFAAVPADLPDTIQDLIAKVRQGPASPWPLKDAADMAGYSPFHFSRVFKSMVGYGFHEFVDRCRTECAVEMLVNTDSPVDIVANACGFGTTQGLRESVKEYLGLVPSELRSVPDSFEFGH